MLTRAEDTANFVPTGKTNRKVDKILKPSAVLAYNRAKKEVNLLEQKHHCVRLPSGVRR